jgi:hypothetical protein
MQRPINQRATPITNHDEKNIEHANNQYIKLVRIKITENGIEMPPECQQCKSALKLLAAKGENTRIILYTCTQSKCQNTILRIETQKENTLKNLLKNHHKQRNRKTSVKKKLPRRPWTEIAPY